MATFWGADFYELSQIDWLDAALTILLFRLVCCSLSFALVQHESLLREHLLAAGPPGRPVKAGPPLAGPTGPPALRLSFTASSNHVGHQH